MSRYLRLRMENCVATILEVNGYLGEGKIRPELVRHFERLQLFLRAVSEECVDEDDIGRIEEATNMLLNEIGDNLKAKSIKYRLRGWIN